MTTLYYKSGLNKVKIVDMSDVLNRLSVIEGKLSSIKIESGQVEHTFTSHGYYDIDIKFGYSVAGEFPALTVYDVQPNGAPAAGQGTDFTVINRSDTGFTLRIYNVTEYNPISTIYAWSAVWLDGFTI